MDILIVALVALWLVGSIVYLAKRKKSGCSGCCENCSGCKK